MRMFEDPVGNQLIVEPLTGRTAVIRLVQQEGEQPCVIITPDEARAIADAVAEACSG
jgi:mRNA-degrading endonuclease toxin of MazEF toxin-antitoxin module